MNWMKSMFGYAQYQPHGLSQAIPIPMVCYKPYSTNELVLYAMFGYAQYQPYGLSQAIPIPMVCYKPYSTDE